MITQRSNDDDEGDGGAAGGARIRDAADEEEDVMDILIKLDAASSERDQLASSQAALQSALQVLLPSADLSRPEKLLEQAKHTASDRANAQQLRQELGLAKRRMDEMERAREAEQGRQRHDEEQLHEELQELSKDNIEELQRDIATKEESINQVEDFIRPDRVFIFQ